MDTFLYACCSSPGRIAVLDRPATVYHSFSVRVCACACVCVLARVRARVFVCVCVAGSIGRRFHRVH